MLASWAKAIMDSTYCKECELIERDFEDQKTYTSILLSLDQILVVSGNLGGDGPVTWLGEEVAETVHWRVIFEKDFRTQFLAVRGTKVHEPGDK